MHPVSQYHPILFCSSRCPTALRQRWRCLFDHLPYSLETAWHMSHQYGFSMAIARITKLWHYCDHHLPVSSSKSWLRLKQIYWGSKRHQSSQAWGWFKIFTLEDAESNWWHPNISPNMAPRHYIIFECSFRKTESKWKQVSAQVTSYWILRFIAAFACWALFQEHILERRLHQRSWTSPKQDASKTNLVSCFDTYLGRVYWTTQAWINEWRWRNTLKNCSGKHDWPAKEPLMPAGWSNPSKAHVLHSFH